MTDAVTLPPSFNLVAFDAVDSTNAEGVRRAAEGAADGTLLWARSQRKGRGRRGRSWRSPPGNLYVSFILRPHCTVREAAQLSFVAAVALGAGLRAVGVTGFAYKWPNDLLLNGAKVAGILLESAADGGSVEWVVMGIGVNVGCRPGDIEGATALHEAGFPDVSVARLLESLAEALDDWRRRWRRDGFAAVRQSWLADAAAKGEELTVRLGASRIVGRFADLDGDGVLLLDLADGRRRRIASGDVSLTPAK